MSDFKVSVFEAILGGEFSVPTFWGTGTITLPENTADKQVFRLRGEGVRRGEQRGDHLIRVIHKFPRKISAQLKKHLEELPIKFKVLGDTFRKSNKEFSSLPRLFIRQFFSLITAYKRLFDESSTNRSQLFLTC